MKVLNSKYKLLFSLSLIALAVVVVLLMMPSSTEETTPETTTSSDTWVILSNDESLQVQIPSQVSPDDCMSWRLSDPPECVYADYESGITLITPQAPAEN